MSGRGHRAVLPPVAFAVDPPLDISGLTVTVVNKAGHPMTFDFAELPVPEPMQRSLAASFAARSRNWTSHRTASTYWYALLDFARFALEDGYVPQDLDGLTAALLKRWRARNIATNHGKTMLHIVGSLLRESPLLHSGPVAEELARRIPAPRSSKRSFEEPEREQVLLAAQQQFRA
ncbi:hypothetical protein ACWDE9_42230, partial [Streptomyces olivaceoviridis]